MAEHQNFPVLLDAGAAAELLGVSRRTFYYVRAELPDFPKPIELRPGMPRYRRDDLLNFIARLQPTAQVQDEPTQLARRHAPRMREGRQVANRAGVA